MLWQRNALTKWRWTTLCLSVSLLTVSSVAYGEASETLARGRNLVVSFEYEAALVELEAVVNDESATASQRIEALELMGVLQFNLHRTARARQMFERLLTLDPAHELTDTSYPPRLRQFYARISESFMPQISIDVEASARQDEVSGEIRIDASASGSTGGVDQAVALVRSSSDESFRRALMTRDGNTFSAEVPVPSGTTQIEYYVEVQAPSGHVLGRAGSSDSPLTAQVVPTASATNDVVDQAQTDLDQERTTGEEARPERHRRRWYASWWFWTIICVAVAGGAATAVVFTLPEQQEEGTLGTRSLP